MSTYPIDRSAVSCFTFAPCPPLDGACLQTRIVSRGHTLNPTSSKESCCVVGHAPAIFSMPCDQTYQDIRSTPTMVAYIILRCLMITHSSFCRSKHSRVAMFATSAPPAGGTGKKITQKEFTEKAWQVRVDAYCAQHLCTCCSGRGAQVV